MSSIKDRLSLKGSGQGGGTTHGVGRGRGPLGVGADRNAPLGTEIGIRSAWVTIPALTTTQPSDSGYGLFTFPGLFPLLQPSPPTWKHPGPAVWRGHPLLPGKVASLGPQTWSPLTPPMASRGRVCALASLRPQGPSPLHQELREPARQGQEAGCWAGSCPPRPKATMSNQFIKFAAAPSIPDP